MSWIAGSFGAAPAGFDGNSSGTNPTANKAYLHPFCINEELTIYGMGWFNGATINGNVDAGIVDDQGSLLTSVGSTAQAGANSIQTVNCADITIGPGNYYLALVSDSATATFFRVAMATLAQLALGNREMTAAFPLPSTITLSPATSAFYPLIIAFTTPTF
jgi:hypothetical protein